MLIENKTSKENRDNRDNIKSGKIEITSNYNCDYSSTNYSFSNSNTIRVRNKTQSSAKHNSTRNKEELVSLLVKHVLKTNLVGIADLVHYLNRCTKCYHQYLAILIRFP